MQELARRGMSVVVIGRNAEKLTATEAAVKAKSPVWALAPSTPPPKPLLLAAC